VVIISANAAQTSPSKMRKTKFVMAEAKKGNKLAKEYEPKLYAGQVSIEWAYKRIRRKIVQDRLNATYEKITQRMDLNTKAKGEAIVDNEETRLTTAIIAANLMLKAGLDITSEQDIDKFLSSNIKEQLPKL
jgi:hypothetical protein